MKAIHYKPARQRKTYCGRRVRGALTTTHLDRVGCFGCLFAILGNIAPTLLVADDKYTLMGTDCNTGVTWKLDVKR